MFDDYLGRPLQLGEYHLNFGQLYLSGGVWNGRRMGSREWVQRSLVSRATLTAYPGLEHPYGYGWHLYRLPWNGRQLDAFGAGGNGGQLVIVVPEFDLVIETTGGRYGNSRNGIHG